MVAAKIVILLATVLVLTTSVMKDGAVVVAVDCGGKPSSWGGANYKLVGNGGFKTVQAAIDSIRPNNNWWTKIHIMAGTYIEQVEIPISKPCIFLEGEGRKVTTITFYAHAETDTSATFTSSPPNVVVKGITFRNSYNLGMSLPKIYTPPGPFEGKPRGRNWAEVVPALAARVYGDKSAFYDCGFVGVQDTLWDATGRHYFSNCYIEGAVDFIFGGGQSFYENAEINVTGGGFITAQARESSQDPSGFVFYRGWVEQAAAGIVTKLGRAYRAYSRVIFVSTYFPAAVDPLGWDAWHSSGQEENIVYAEVNCKGPGAYKSKRVPWEKDFDHNPVALKQFSKQLFVDRDRWIENQPTS